MALPDGTEPARQHPDGLRAPATRPLPRRFHEDGVDEDGFLLGLRERRSEPVRLPLLAPGMHLLLLGDGGSGRTTQLHRAARWLAHRSVPQDVQLHLVGPRRSLLDLARLPATRAHAYDSSSLDQLVRELAHTLESRRPPAGLTAAALLRQRWWDGPRHVLVVDDQDLLPGEDPGFGAARGLAPLAALLPHSADIGWHVLLARPVMGMARAAYDPFLSRLREVTPLTLVLSGDRTEGVVAGAVAATALPPGRGRLVRAKDGPVGGELVQCALPADPLPE